MSKFDQYLETLYNNVSKNKEERQPTSKVSHKLSEDESEVLYSLVGSKGLDKGLKDFFAKHPDKQQHEGHIKSLLKREGY